MTNKASVLVIDDDRTTIALIEAALEGSDFDVKTTMSSNEGINISKLSTPDIILLDKNMPEMSGEKVLTWLKLDDDTKNIPVIMLTGDDDMMSISSSLEQGAADHIVKPFGRTNLIARINKAVGK